MTHVNAYKTDLEDAYKAAVGAVSELKTKMDKLVEKMEADVADNADAAPAPATANAPEPAAANEPSADPGADGVDHSGDPVPAGSTKAK